jgi:hypothetical protein
MTLIKERFIFIEYESRLLKILEQTLIFVFAHFIIEIDI